MTTISNIEAPKLRRNKHIILPFPEKDPFIIYATRYSAPEYLEIMMYIGVKSKMSDYKSFSGLYKEAVLFHITTFYTSQVPWGFGELVWNKIFPYLHKYQDKIYGLLINNTKVFNSFGPSIVLNYGYKKDKLYFYLDIEPGLLDLDQNNPELGHLYSYPKDLLKTYKDYIITNEDVDKYFNNSWESN